MYLVGQCIEQMDFQCIQVNIDMILHDLLLDTELRFHKIPDMDLYICCSCKPDLMGNLD